MVESQAGRTPMEQRARRIARGGTAVFATSLTLKGTSVLASILIARHLGPYQLGEWSLVTSVTGLAWMFIELGTGTAAVRLVSAARASDPERAQRLSRTYVVLELLLSLPVLLAFAGSATWLSTDLYGDPVLLPLFWLSIAGLFLSTLVACYAALMQAFERIRLLARMNLVFGASHSVLLVVFVLLWGLVGGFTASLVANAAQCLTYAALFKDVRPFRLDGWRLRRDDVTEILFYAVPTFMSGVMLVAFNWIGATIVTGQIGVETLGHFSVAQRLAFVVLYIPSAIVVPFFPMATGLYQTSPSDFTRTLNHTLRYILLISFPATLIVAAFSRILVGVLYTDAYAEAAALLPILAGASLLASFLSPAILVFYVTGAMRRQIALTSAAFAAATVGVVLLVPAIGVEGFAWSYLLYYAVTIALAPVLHGALFPDPRYRRMTAVALGLSGIVLTAGLLLARLEPFIASVIAIGTVAATAVGIYAKAFTERDRAFLRRLLEDLVGRRDDPR